MKKLILIIALIFLASCATAPVQKSDAPAPVISAEEVETADTDQDQPSAIEIYDSSEDAETEDPAIEPEPESETAKKIKDAAAATGMFLLEVLWYNVETSLAGGGIW